RRREATKNAVEVGPARGGWALDDSEPVGREDERGYQPSQLAGRPQRGAVGRSRSPSPRRTVTSSSSPTSPRRPTTAARAPSAPKRTTCESVRVRGEKPWVATWTASSRFVLPRPRAPTDSST